jgi:hypothetical protein
MMHRLFNIPYSLEDARIMRTNKKAGDLSFAATLVFFTEGVLTGVATFKLAPHSNAGVIKMNGLT